MINLNLSLGLAPHWDVFLRNDNALVVTLLLHDVCKAGGHDCHGDEVCILLT
jgi:hypothetical protein